MNKPFKSLKEMQAAMKSYRFSWNGDFSGKALVYACERLDEIAELLRKGKRRGGSRKSSAWNRFVSEGMKRGKSLKQIAEEWRARQR